MFSAGCSCRSRVSTQRRGHVRTLQIVTDTWCSSGAFDADGNMVQTGGFFEGDKSVRYLSACGTCDWKEFPKSLADGRW